MRYVWLVLVLGCGVTDLEHSLTGEWSDMMRSAYGDIGLELDLMDHGRLEGDAWIWFAVSQDTFPMVVTGTHRHPTVEIRMKPAAYDEMIITGECVDEDRIRGSLDGSGFDGIAVHLHRR